MVGRHALAEERRCFIRFLDHENAHNGGGGKSDTLPAINQLGIELVPYKPHVLILCVETTKERCLPVQNSAHRFIRVGILQLWIVDCGEPEKNYAKEASSDGGNRLAA